MKKTVMDKAADAVAKYSYEFRKKLIPGMNRTIKIKCLDKEINSNGFIAIYAFWEEYPKSKVVCAISVDVYSAQITDTKSATQYLVNKCNSLLENYINGFNI